MSQKCRAKRIWSSFLTPRIQTFSLTCSRFRMPLRYRRAPRWGLLFDASSVTPLLFPKPTSQPVSPDCNDDFTYRLIARKSVIFQDIFDMIPNEAHFFWPANPRPYWPKQHLVTSMARKTYLARKIHISVPRHFSQIISLMMLSLSNSEEIDENTNQYMLWKSHLKIIKILLNLAFIFI